MAIYLVEIGSLRTKSLQTAVRMNSSRGAMTVLKSEWVLVSHCRYRSTRLTNVALKVSIWTTLMSNRILIAATDISIFRAENANELFPTRSIRSLLREIRACYIYSRMGRPTILKETRRDG